jgi:phosphoserine phosphatase RsbU/P
MAAHDEIEFLAELSRVVASSQNLNSVLEWIVEETPKRLAADGGSIKLTGDDDITVSVIRRMDGYGSWPRAITISVMGYLQLTHGPLATADILADPRFPGMRGLESPVRAILAVPLQVGARIIGMLGVGRREAGREWSPEEIRLAEIVAAHSAEVIEILRHRRRTDELQQEIAMAGKLQQSLLPVAPLRFGPWEITGRVVPARHVGGDYFDYFALDRDRVGLAIADVVGKGLPAAMLVSSISVLVRLSCDGRRPLGDAFAQMNRYLAHWDDPRKSATLFFGEMDFRRGLMRYVRAGHNYPLVRRAGGQVEELREGERPLGLFADVEYEEGQVRIEDGDTLLLYSDGVTDAKRPDGELFGEERLASLWGRCPDGAPERSVEKILEEVSAFRGVEPQSDDISVVVAGSRVAP